jgi:hypothetical protein
MRKTLIAIMLALALVLIPVSSAFAETSQDVTVTATPTFISIANAPNSFDFDVVDASGTPDTTTGYFDVTNDSTVNIDVDIVCDGWHTPPVDHWTYGAAGADTALLNASDGDGAYDVEVDDVTPTLLHTTVAAGDEFEWELQLEAPTSFSYGDEQTTTVTISASAS